MWNAQCASLCECGRLRARLVGKEQLAAELDGIVEELRETFV